MGNIVQPKMFGQQLNLGHWSTDGLVGYWRFIEAGNAVDESFYGNHGTFVGAPVWQGEAVSFDGAADYIDMGDVLDITGNITLVASINRTGDSTGGVAGTIVGKEMASGNQYSMDLMDSGNFPNNKIRVFTFDLSDTDMASTSTITNGMWYHVAFTYNGATKIIYINGLQDAEEAATGSMVVNTDSLKIGFGQSSGATNNYYNGLIRSVSIYNRALSASEIQQLYINPDLLIEQDVSWMAKAPAVGVVIPVMIHHYKQAGGL